MIIDLFIFRDLHDAEEVPEVQESLRSDLRSVRRAVNYSPEISANVTLNRYFSALSPRSLLHDNGRLGHEIAQGLPDSDSIRFDIRWFPSVFPAVKQTYF